MKEEESEEEFIFIPLPPHVYKYLELLKRRGIIIFREDVNQRVYYIGDLFVHVINASGKFNTTYYYLNGILLAEKDISGNKKFYHPDHLGSTSLITNSTGSIVEETFYLSFGEILDGEQRAGIIIIQKK